LSHHLLLCKPMILLRINICC